MLTKYPALSPTAAEAMGYAELIELVFGRSDLDEAVERIKIATRQLARRQMKWFRRFNPVHWLDGREPIEQLAEQTLRILEWTELSKIAKPLRRVEQLK